MKHAQLLEAGVSRHRIYHAIETGALHRRHAGVYVVGHLALAPYANETAGLMACGERTLISHWSLLAEAELKNEPVHVTIVGRQCRPKQGICLHRVTTLDRGDLRRRRGLPVTSPARTIIDLSAAATWNELERLIAEARARRLIRDGELEKALERAGSRRGTAILRAVLRAEGEPGITRSEGERILRRYLRAAQLPQPRTNRKIGVWEADFLWPAERVVLELDSYDFRTPNPKKLRARVGKLISGGGRGVILFHDTKKSTAKAIAQIFDDLEAMNCARLAAGQEPVLPVSLHYFLRDHGAPRPVPAEVDSRTKHYRDNLPTRCANRPQPPETKAPEPHS